jgi:hypothetical protein
MGGVLLDLVLVGVNMAAFHGWNNSQFMEEILKRSEQDMVQALEVGVAKAVVHRRLEILRL